MCDNTTKNKKMIKTKYLLCVDNLFKDKKVIKKRIEYKIIFLKIKIKKIFFEILAKNTINHGKTGSRLK